MNTIRITLCQRDWQRQPCASKTIAPGSARLDNPFPVRMHSADRAAPDRYYSSAVLHNVDCQWRHFGNPKHLDIHVEGVGVHFEEARRTREQVQRSGYLFVWDKRNVWRGKVRGW